MNNPFQQVIDEAASVDHSINDDDYYIVHPGKKHIVSKVYHKVHYGQDANVVLKSYIDSADKKHGAGHKAMKGMHIKREAGYTRLSETTEYADVISRSVLGSYSTNVDETEQKKEVSEAEVTTVKDKEGKVISFKYSGDWKKAKGDGTTVDKSGAKHTPYSKARDKARAAIKKVSESERIDELSKSTLASYVKKAADSATQNGYHAGGESERYASEPISKRPDSYGKARKKAIDRLRGINKAVARLTKEDVEQQHAEQPNREASVASESMVAREVGGRKFVSAEAAIRLAREIAAKRKEGEKPTHNDLIAAKKKLVGEETIDESFEVVDAEGKVVHVAYSEGEAKKYAVQKRLSTGKKHTVRFKREASVPTK